VFTPVRPSSSGTLTATSGFVTDWSIVKSPLIGGATYAGTRLTGGATLTPHSDVAEWTVGFSFDFMDKTTIAGTGDYSTWIAWNFKRAPGFFDVVCYEGTNSVKTESHNLGVAPEMMIFKCRDATEHWPVYHKDLTSAGHHLLLNLDKDERTSSATWNSTDPTASVFTVGVDNYTNGYPGGNSKAYVAYLFASCPGVSKVGTYDGDSDSTIPVDCEFTSGARFVLIKRIDDDGDWYLLDSVRGITTGSDDPYLLMNEDDAEVTTADRLDSNTAGFTVRPYSDAGGALNEDGGTYIYLAIA